MYGEPLGRTPSSDFKATLYGQTDGGRRGVCKLIAALHNGRGGVEFSDEEERRMLRVVAVKVVV